MDFSKSIKAELVKNEAAIKEHMAGKKQTVNNVSIGDRFIIPGKNKQTATVTDFYEVKSVTTGQLIKNICIAVPDSELCNTPFEVAFASVVRRKIQL